jgi:BlaI family penicillinase repressor
MEKQNLGLTEAEWAVMECLWEKQPRTGRELTEALQRRMNWSRSTTLTLLRRLEGKGAVASDPDAEPMIFRPLIAREDVAIAETRHLLDRAYRGSLSLLVSALTRRETLPQKEIDELYAILAEMEEKNHD